MKKIILAFILITGPLHATDKSLQPLLGYSTTASLGGYLTYLAWQTPSTYHYSAPFLGFLTLYCAGKAQQYFRQRFAPLKAAPANIRIFNEEVDSDSVIIFAHGLGATGAQAGLYAQQGLIKHPYPTNNEVIFTGPFVTFDFPDAINDRMMFNPDQVVLGQSHDVERLYEVIQETRAKFSGKKLILFGLSRGASTVLNIMADSTKHLDDISAIIAEAPFDSFDSLLANKKFKGIPQLPGLSALIHKLTPMIFPHFNLDGLFPKDTVSALSKTTPLLLISSQEDDVVPTQCAANLAALAQCKHLQLQKGKHGKYIIGDDQKRYAQALREFLGNNK